MNEKRLFVRIVVGLLTLVMALTIVQPTPLAKAATITVDMTADDTDINGNCTLREAIIAANTDTPVDNCPAGSGADTITLPAGTYTLAIIGAGENAAVTGDLDITSSLTIIGAGAADTIINGGALDRVFEIHIGTTVDISNITVRNGSVGGVFPTDDGGGIVNDGTITLADSRVSGNTANGRGGGISNGGSLTLIRSTVSGNNATGAYGGGIANAFGGSLTVVESTINGNLAASQGGGLVNDSHSEAILTNSTVSGNTSGSGGGIDNGGMLTIKNSTIIGNTSVGFGGGIRYGGGTADLQNTILAGNSTDTIGPDCAGLISSSGYNLIGDTSDCTFTPTTGDITNINPLLSTLQDNGGPTLTHALLPGSKAIDAIPPASCIFSTDQRGIHRPQGAACDIGAFEAEAVQVNIDIKPGRDPNSILCTNEKGVIAVAILTTDDFDATTVDHTTVTFEGASETHVNKKSGEPRRHEQDVDKDGDIDLVFHFRFGDTDLTCGSTEGTLTGETFDGQLFRGSDAVNPIPPYYYTALLNDPDASQTAVFVGLLSFGLFAGMALVLGTPAQLKRRRKR